jgi:hypothetical protein
LRALFMRFPRQGSAPLERPTTGRRGGIVLGERSAAACRKKKARTKARRRTQE